MSRANKYKGPVGPLRHRCPQCSATGSHLLRCSACRAVRYCSREHQAAHRSQHKSARIKVKKARAELAQEDHAVRNATTDFDTPANAFETHVGRFWGLTSTSDYILARFSLANQLRMLGTLDGVDEALSHMQDMLRLCRNDNMGLRDLVPAMMLRLDLDQECYDFVKWWATFDPDGDWHWGDMTRPHLDLRGADALEDPDFLDEDSALNHLVAILLLKLKLVVDTRNLKVTRKILAIRCLPLDLWESIELSVIRSPLSAKLQRLSPESLSKAEAKILDQIRDLDSAIVEANESFMFYLFEPDEYLHTSPDVYSKGSREEMAYALENSYAAWWETEGVLWLLSEARAFALRDTEDQIDELMAIQAKQLDPDAHRTPEDILATASLLRIGGYLGLAIENASFLGPSFERPSERYRREYLEDCTKAKAEEKESGAPRLPSHIIAY